MSESPAITVVGSANLDLVITVSRLPVPGETVSSGTLSRFPGGKGANQALAAKRLGARVSLLACVGDDANADEALALLEEGGVDLSRCQRSTAAATGVAMVVVASNGENQIAVAPGANRLLQVDRENLPTADALICQLEVPAEALLTAVEHFAKMICINLAPARKVPAAVIERADLIVLNETEATFYGTAIHESNAMVVTTLGASGAVARRNGREIAKADSPRVDVVDTTAAGDAFTAALTVALASGKPIGAALEFACVAGAIATSRSGAQPSLPFLREVESFPRSGSR